jgi:hypothetical protein
MTQQLGTARGSDAFVEASSKPLLDCRARGHWPALKLGSSVVSTD